MIKLNLLPPQQKEELRLVEFNRLLVSFAFRFSIVLVIFILLLISSYFCLLIIIRAQNNLIEVRQNDEKAQYQAEVEQRIEQINQEVGKISVKQDKLIIWTPILERLSKITPRGLYLINFSYQASNNKVSLTGWAENRDKLLRFEKLLKETPYFGEVEAPLSNLIKQTDINFSFIIKVGPYVK